MYTMCFLYSMGILLRSWRLEMAVPWVWSKIWSIWFSAIRASTSTVLCGIAQYFVELNVYRLFEQDPSWYQRYYNKSQILPHCTIYLCVGSTRADRQRSGDWNSQHLPRDLQNHRASIVWEELLWDAETNGWQLQKGHSRLWLITRFN